MTQRTSILIVEDDRIIARSLQQMLRDLGYDVWAVASSAEEALARASERVPGLALMDIRLPGQLDGIAAAAILRERFDVPIVFLTAHADEDTLERAKLIGPHGYLVKPVKPEELRSAIEVAVCRHDMERRLREREQWFSTTLRSIADAVIAVDLAGNVAFMNPAAEALTGTTAAETHGKPVRLALNLVGVEETPLERALRSRQRVDLVEGQLVNLRDGSVHMVADSAAPVLDGSEHLGAVMVFRDITEQRRIRQQLELADRLASLGTMAAGVAHEVNNPLTVVTGNVDFIAQELDALRADAEPPSASRAEEDQRWAGIDSALDDIRSAAQRIARIVSDLKAFSRPHPASASRADVSRCIDWALRATSRELRHRAQVVTQIETLPPVAMDETRLGQVLINLLVNAAQAIPPGNADAHVVTVKAHATSQAEVAIEVRDTGPGISKDALSHIFEPFFTTKGGSVGTGLGLSICHGIISAAGGRIDVSSTVGRGTTMRGTLPVAPASEPAPPLPSSHGQFVRGKLLIIDDEPIVLSVLGRILRDHDVQCLTHAQAALDLLASGESFDLIFTDVMMPTMTGMEFYAQLRDRHPELTRRVIFLTGGPLGAQLDEFLRTVPNRLISKPFDVGTLREAVQRLLRAQAAREATFRGKAANG